VSEAGLTTTPRFKAYPAPRPPWPAIEERGVPSHCDNRRLLPSEWGEVLEPFDLVASEAFCPSRLPWANNGAPVCPVVSADHEMLRSGASSGELPTDLVAQSDDAIGVFSG
jgi:hypothetical protein